MVVRSLILALSMVLMACSNNQGGKSQANNENNGSKGLSETPVSAKESEMVYFKSGTFIMGSANGLPNEQPVHKVTVQSFKIDKYPVTVKNFRRFVEATGYTTDAERFGDSGVFDFNTSSWTLIPGANWQYPLGKNSSRAADNK